MPFCELSSEIGGSSYTVIENAFITQFMPDAPPRYTEIYLYGLMLCSQGADNTFENLCAALNLSPTDVKTAFAYWEELGIVRAVGADELKVIYLPINATVSMLKKIKPGKYYGFNKKIQNILTDRIILPNEYNEYYVFLETTSFEPDALIAVAEYSSDLKGKNVSYQYVLTVARDLATHGKKSADTVKNELSARAKHSDDVKVLLKTLGSSRKIDASDEKLFEKWTDDFGFGFDVINGVAKKVKYGGMGGLDKLIAEYYENRLFSLKEIENYSENKTKLYDLAKRINKTVGVYYQTLDMVVSEYVAPWLGKGYDDETLLLVARYCFKSGIRTLEGMNSAVERFYKLGLVTQNAIHQYIAEVVDGDARIKQILAAAGINRRVINQDRANMKIWTNEWNLSEELILFAAQKSRGAVNPTAYMCKLLSSYKEQGVKTVEQAEKNAADKKSAASVAREYKQREYTSEELHALFDNLDEIEV